MSVKDAKFRKPVVPGNVLSLEVVPLRKGTTVWRLRGEAKVSGAVVAEAEFMASIQWRSA